MLYKVFHWQGDNTFKHVANVKVPDEFLDTEERALDFCFQVTNHIDRNWEENYDVEPARLRNRSTSVGDMVVRFHDGKRWICDSIGWKELE